MSRDQAASGSEPAPAGGDAELAELAAALTESDARYRAIVDALEEGVTVHDVDGRILAVNPSAERILGAPAEVLVGCSVLGPEWGLCDITSAPVGPERHPVVRALSEPGSRGVARGVLGVIDRMGEQHWLSITAIRTETLAARRVVCLFDDITFERHEEEQRQRTELNFRTLIEGTPDAVAVYRNDRLAYANPTMVSLLGYGGVAEMLGRPPTDFVHPDDRTIDRVLFSSMPAPGARPVTPRVEERFLRRDGSPVPVEVTTIPIFFDDAPATLVHARDVTERKRLEAQVLMADRLASVGRLAAAVGHEINNPLAYVLANLDLVLERLSEPGLRLRGGSMEDEEEGRFAELLDILRDARDGADRVRHIVRDLKVFSRGETEERTRIDPRTVIDSCVNMARGEIRQRAQVVKVYGETPLVLVNQARLGQVLLNLLVNAAHAIPEGDPDANEIRVTTRTDERGRAVIEVRDTGAGIPDEVKPRVFEPFFTTKAAKSGSGLGLSICQSIVTALGGQITFESHVGRGTAFRVILPPAPPAPGSSPPRSSK